MKKKIRQFMAVLLAVITILGDYGLCFANSISENSIDAGGYEESYYGDQSMEEMIEILSSGRAASEFFRYSIWTFLTVDDLKFLVSKDMDLTDLFDYLYGNAYYDYPEMEDMMQRFMGTPMPMSVETEEVTAEGLSAIAVTEVKNSSTGGAVVTFGPDISTSALGTISAFGAGNHGPMKSIYLNEEEAFCAWYGASCSTGMTYQQTTHTALGISDAQYGTLKRIYSWYQKAQGINDNTANLAIAQAAFWLVLAGNWTGDPAGMAGAISPLFGKTVLTSETALSLFTGMTGWVNNPAEVAYYDLTFWSNGGNQYLVTGFYNPPPPPPESSSQSAYVVIKKTDSITGGKLSGTAKFKIYDSEGNNTKIKFTKDGNTYKSGTITTTTAGAKYYVKETSAPTGYVKDTEKYYFTIDEGDDNAKKVIYNNKEDKTFENTPYYVQVKVDKRDEKTKAAIANNATFTVHAKKGELSKAVTFTKQADGSYLSSKIYYNESNEGEFYLTETKAPANYYGDYTDGATGKVAGTDAGKIQYTFSVTKKLNGTVIDITNSGSVFTNTPVMGSLSITKLDKDRGTNQSQGDATLEGAVYGLYAAENISLPDGSKVVYPAGTLVTKLTLNKEAKASAANLYLGNYHLKEITPPKGYLLDTTVYPVGITYKDETQIKVDASQTVSDKVMKQAFQLIKVGGGENADEVNVLSAGFKVYLISSLSGVKNGSIKADANGNYNIKDFVGYDFSREQTALMYNASGTGIPMPELFTDANGYLLSPELAYGKYVVIESTVPQGYAAIDPFFVTINGDSRTPQKWRVFFDDVFEAKLKVNKKDAGSKENVLVAGTKYRIYDRNRQTYVTQWTTYPALTEHGTEENPFVTDENGYLITPQVLPIGDYLLEEVGAPDGYVLTGYEGHIVDGEVAYEPKENITFSIHGKAAYYTDGDTSDVIIVADQYNEPVKGVLRLKKRGEVLTGTSVSENGVTFHYEEKSLEGAEFSVYAKEEILSPDGQGRVLYAKDELVAELTTDAEGEASVENLPLGSYYVKETSSGGEFVRNDEIKDFVLSYEGQETPVVFADVEFTNKRQNIDISITKDDVETGEMLAGAQFTLYSAQDFGTYGDSVSENSVNEESETAIGSAAVLYLAKDEPIETVTTDEEGKAAFLSDLPNGYYYIRETKAPEGYVGSNDVMTVDASFTDEEEHTLLYEFHASNEKIKGAIGIAKKDGTDGEYVKGAKLGLFDENDACIEEFYTGNGVYYINNLVLGKYTIKELETPKGYIKAEDITVWLGSSEEILYVEMTDERPYAQINIEKSDAESKEKLKDAKFAIRRMDTGKVVEVMTTSGNGIATSKQLPIATYENGQVKEYITYQVTEKKAPKGYSIDFQGKEITFEYEDDSTIMYVEWVYAKDKKIPEPPKEEKPPVEITPPPDGKLPQTWDGFNSRYCYQIGIGALLAAILLLLISRRKLTIAGAIIFTTAGLIGMALPDIMSDIGQKERETYWQAYEELVSGNDTGKEVVESVSENEVKKPLQIGGVIGSIRIPKLDISYPIAEGCETKDLRYTIGHYPGSGEIGRTGNCVLAGHRGGRYGEFFKNVHKLTQGDEIYLSDAAGREYSYEVETQYVTSATDLKVLSQENEELTLITCENQGKERRIIKCKKRNM